MKKPVGPIIQTNTNLVSQKDPNTVEPSSNDQNMIYAYEGEGSEVGSLSSISSDQTDKDQEYDYLKEWGPKFYKLSNIYLKNDDNMLVDYQNHGYEYRDDQDNQIRK